MQLPSILKIISHDLKHKGAKAIVVGGCVRDYYLKLPIKDYDIEVYNLKDLNKLEEILSAHGSVNLVGKSFGVLKFVYDGDEYDFSFPRRESKTGKAHNDFYVEVDSYMEFKEAALRRDFTINAMGYDIEKKEFLDPFHGLEDMKKKILQHINSKTFKEDALRVYRAVQFCARFDYSLADETKLLCKEMVSDGELEYLAKERVFDEFKKLLLKSSKPSLGFELMRELGVLKYFVELQAIIGVEQSKKWHPEGDVWIHTMMSLDAMTDLLGDDKKTNLVLMLAILCHDLGKATTTTIDESGCIRSIGHEDAGVELTTFLIARLSDEVELLKRVLPLVKYHMQPSQFYYAKSKDKAIRRLATKVNIKELLIVAKADFLGRTTKESKLGIFHAGDWLEKKSKNLKVQTKALDNLLQGRDLIAIGIKPSPKFKEILGEVYSLQLDGMLKTKDEALDFVLSSIKIV